MGVGDLNGRLIAGLALVAAFIVAMLGGCAGKESGTGSPSTGTKLQERVGSGQQEPQFEFKYAKINQVENGDLARAVEFFCG